MFKAISNLIGALADLTIELRRSRTHLAQVNDLVDGILVQTPDEPAAAIDEVDHRNNGKRKLVSK